jgi:hypothetical protein
VESSDALRNLGVTIQKFAALMYPKETCRIYTDLSQESGELGNVPRDFAKSWSNEAVSRQLVCMEYRGKSYSIVQGIGPNSWKWTVHLDEKIAKSGEAKSRSTANVQCIWLIDKALASKGRSPRRPDKAGNA